MKSDENNTRRGIEKRTVGKLSESREDDEPAWFHTASRHNGSVYQQVPGLKDHATNATYAEEEDIYERRCYEQERKKKRMSTEDEEKQMLASLKPIARTDGQAAFEKHNVDEDNVVGIGAIEASSAQFEPLSQDSIDPLLLLDSASAEPAPFSEVNPNLFTGYFHASTAQHAACTQGQPLPSNGAGGQLETALFVPTNPDDLNYNGIGLASLPSRVEQEHAQPLDSDGLPASLSLLDDWFRNQMPDSSLVDVNEEALYILGPDDIWCGQAGARSSKHNENYLNYMETRLGEYLALKPGKPRTNFVRNVVEPELTNAGRRFLEPAIMCGGCSATETPKTPQANSSSCRWRQIIAPIKKHKNGQRPKKKKKQPSLEERQLKARWDKITEHFLYRKKKLQGG